MTTTGALVDRPRTEPEPNNTTATNTTATSTRTTAATTKTRPAAKLPSLTELVDAIQNGQDEAWAQLIHRLNDRVQATLHRITTDSHMKSDATAETWKVLFERLHQVKDPECLPSWVSVVARNKMFDLIKRNGKISTVDFDEVSERVGSPDDDFVVAAETSAALRCALKRLSQREQAIVVGRVVTSSPDSLQEMGLRLNMPTGSIGPTLGRSLNKLRRDPELRRFLADYETRAA